MRFRCRSFFCVSLLHLPPAQEINQEKAAAKWITPAAEKSITQGLRWLAERQHEDGSFGNGPARGNVAVCGLAGMAFMSGGSTPGRGPYGENVNKCVDFILANAKPSGFLNGPDTATHGPMYGHGFAAMFLAECHGMSARAELRDALNKAVKLIADTQNNDGGWRYLPATRGRRYFRDRLPGDGLARRPQRRHLRAPRRDRPLDQLYKAEPEPGRRFHVQDSRRRKRFPRSAAAVAALYSTEYTKARKSPRASIT